MRGLSRVRCRGFSLLELVVAIAILALALGVFYRALGGGVRTVADVSQQSRALGVAESILQTHDAVMPGGWRESGAWQQFRWTVESAPLEGPDQPAPALHRVRIEVSWPGNGSPRSVSVVTLLPEKVLPP